MIFSLIVFLASYLVYISTYLRNGIAMAYPVYIAPLLVIGLNWLAAYVLSKIEKKRFSLIFRTVNQLLYIFMLLAAAPLLLKMNLPDPHNFPLRKLELLLGAAYAVFIFSLAGYFIYSAAKTIDIQKMKINKVFAFIFAFTFAFFFSVSLWFNYANQPTGDEPEYLMMAASLAKDGDLDLENNYANKDYAAFYNKDLTAQGKSENKKLYSYHPPLVSVFLLPFYAAAGRLGATILMNLLCAFFTALIFYFLSMIYRENRMPAAAALLCAFSLPVLMFSNMICSEALSGVLILGCLIIFIYKKEKFYSAAIACALIPWSHPRNAVLWLALGIIAIIEYRKEIAKAGIFTLIQSVSGALLLWFNYSHFGSFVPGAYTETVKHASSGQSFSLNPAGMLGLFFDQEFGLFFYTPLFAVFIAGIIALFNKDRKLFWYSLLLFVPYYLMLSSYAGWSGGGGASPRFFVPVIFLFVLFTAEALRSIKDKAAVIAARMLVFAGLIISLVIFMVPWFRWNKGIGDNWILKCVSGFVKADITGILPSFWAPDKNTWLTAFIWLAAAVILNVFFMIKRGKSF